MIEFIVVVREAGTIEVDYSIALKAPAVPQIGSYISIARPDRRNPLSEGLIGWRLRHNETHGFASTETLGYRALTALGASSIQHDLKSQMCPCR